MADHPTPAPRAEREARRALLEEALGELTAAADPERAAQEVMRALDGYMESVGGGSALSPREPPVTDFDRREHTDVRWGMWVVLGCAVIATCVVAVALSGGWPAALAVAAIWVVALIALTTA